MIATKKTLLLVITFFYIAIINANAFTNQFQCDIEKTTKYTAVEYEKECEKEKDQIDEFTNDFFAYSVFSTILIQYCNTQKKNSFKLSLLLYRPPIAS
ncbi:MULTISPECIES: hypothetical protein [Sulfurimonas]|uniref:hypothetical protein n=1 Tax=Sulfurimonas TaxID=202746 RepID=UPI001265A345|nr:hypothetical protein [Sulfurimonas indica]